MHYFGLDISVFLLIIWSDFVLFEDESLMQINPSEETSSWCTSVETILTTVHDDSFKEL